MIQKIQIQNYRSCLYTTIDFHPQLSVLIGPNGSGKTNILNALLLLRKLTEEGV
jgi:putative ATP-dependent endonuclease of OLD family